LVLSYIFDKVIFHVTLKKVAARLSYKKEEVVCKLSSKSLNTLQGQIIPFVNGKMYPFIREIVANKNWIGTFFWEMMEVGGE
jgi:hypothetical protein